MTMKSELIVKDKVAATGALGVPVFRYSCGIIQWRIGGMGLGGFKQPPSRNAEVLTKSNRIANWAENV